MGGRIGVVYNWKEGKENRDLGWMEMEMGCGVIDLPDLLATG